MSIKLHKTYFENFLNNNSIDIVQIGAGGTGSALVPHIARLMSQDSNRINYILIDGDRVASHNINRQNFIKSDIGLYKSEVLAKRYSNAFGVSITCIPKYLDSDLAKSLELWNKDIIIGCVDNNKTRVIIADSISEVNKYNVPIYIDSGNELNGGQCFIQNRIYRMSSGPELLIEHSEIAKATDELPTERSCAENQESGDQRLTTNLTAAIMLFNVLDMFINHTKVPFYEVNWTTSNSVEKKYLDDWLKKEGNDGY